MLFCWQGRDYWARFERFVKTLAWSNDDVYIVTGPLYVPQKTPQGYVMHHSMIGGQLHEQYLTISPHQVSSMLRLFSTKLQTDLIPNWLYVLASG